MLTMAQLNAMSEAELRQLNHNVVDTLRRRVVETQRQAANQFRTGDKATFFHKGRNITMEIQRFNQKTVGGVELDAYGVRTARTWRVPPSMLRKVETPKAAESALPTAGSDMPVTRKPGVW